MKITNLTVQKEEGRMEDGGPALVCVATMENGEKIETGVPWRNDRGLWASDSDSRDAEEIAAFLKNFAGAIEKYAAAKEPA